MKQKTALVFGATGLIGKTLVDALIHQEEYTRIKVFLRKEAVYSSSKVEVVCIDFLRLEDCQSKIMGDELFCCLGTTIKKAGSQKAFRKVDYDLVIRLGVIAKKNSIDQMTVVSSLGADPGSSNFYLRTKGEMEEALKKMKLKKLILLRPSLLLGSRDEFRPGESIGKVVMKILSPFLKGKFKKYRPVHAETIAAAIIRLAKIPGEMQVVESDKIRELGY